MPSAFNDGINDMSSLEENDISGKLSGFAPLRLTTQRDIET